jgi:hypothetical protein
MADTTSRDRIRETSGMTTPTIGQRVKVHYVDQLPYTLDVVVTAICAFNEFIGQIEFIHGNGHGPVLPGNEICQLKGQHKTFKNAAIVE